MTDASVLSSPTDGETLHQEVQKPDLWSRLALGAILLLSIFMNFFLLGENGYGNLFYASGIRSMLDSWHNFFFVSYDPGGFVTIDKPPVGFWLQTLSAKIFGFTPFSIFLPQALSGVLAVLLLYALIKKHFGIIAGLVAALVLAVTPISVVTNRNNTIDSTLALVLLLAAWSVLRAAESGKLRWLLLTAVFVGLGFNVKMSEAYLAIPALFMAYLLCAPGKLWTRIWHLLVFSIVMIVISLSWAATVDSIPAADRPYVGSTQDNSEISLAIGYNGLNRLHIGGNTRGGGTRTGGGNGGRNGGGRRLSTTSNASARATPGGSANATPAGTTNVTGTDSTTPGFRGGFGGGAGQFNPSGNAGDATATGFAGFGGFGGAANPLSLFTGTSLGGQIGWLLPFGLLGILALAWQRRLRLRKDRQLPGMILWGLWLVVMAVFFTIDGSFHEYYMTVMAPGLAACSGIGLTIMWQDYRRSGWRGWLLPVALVITAGIQMHMLSSYPAYSKWMIPVIAILTASAVLALILFRIRPQIKFNSTILRLSGVAVTLGLLTLLIAPTIWAGYGVLTNTESSDPLAGPGGGSSFGNAGGGGGRNGSRGLDLSESTVNSLRNLASSYGIGGDAIQTNTTLIKFLEANQGSTRFLVAVASSQQADSFILTTNKPVMAMGGFNGGDPILTTSSLQTLIHNNTIRYFLINSQTGVNNILNDLPEQIRAYFGGGNTNNTNATGRAAGGARGGGFGQRGSSSALTSWITSHCSKVSANDWETPGSISNNGSILYDCASARA